MPGYSVTGPHPPTLAPESRKSISVTMNGLLGKIRPGCRNLLWLLGRLLGAGARQSHFSTFTTRARISPAMTSAMADCSIIVIFAHLLVGSVSVGLNAVALVNAR